VRLAPHAWQVVLPIRFTNPQRRHLYGVLKGRTPARFARLHAIAGPNGASGQLGDAAFHPRGHLSVRHSERVSDHLLCPTFPQSCLLDV
jgi:hypothetical protein